MRARYQPSAGAGGVLTARPGAGRERRSAQYQVGLRAVGQTHSVEMVLMFMREANGPAWHQTPHAEVVCHAMQPPWTTHSAPAPLAETPGAQRSAAALAAAALEEALQSVKVCEPPPTGVAPMRCSRGQVPPEQQALEPSQQVPEHTTLFLEQQTLDVQISPEAQALPQVPQFFASVCFEVQALPQASGKASGHAQAPDLQIWFVRVQGVAQSPQCSASVFRSEHASAAAQ